MMWFSILLKGADSLLPLVEERIKEIFDEGMIWGELLHSPQIDTVMRDYNEFVSEDNLAKILEGDIQPIKAQTQIKSFPISVVGFRSEGVLYKIEIPTGSTLTGSSSLFRLVRKTEQGWEGDIEPMSVHYKEILNELNKDGQYWKVEKGNLTLQDWDWFSNNFKQSIIKLLDSPIPQATSQDDPNIEHLWRTGYKPTTESMENFYDRFLPKYIEISINANVHDNSYPLMLDIKLVTEIRFGATAPAGTNVEAVRERRQTRYKYGTGKRAETPFEDQQDTETQVMKFIENNLLYFQGILNLTYTAESMERESEDYPEDIESWFYYSKNKEYAFANYFDKIVAINISQIVNRDSHICMQYISPNNLKNSLSILRKEIKKLQRQWKGERAQHNRKEISKRLQGERYKRRMNLAILKMIEEETYANPQLPKDVSDKELIDYIHEFGGQFCIIAPASPRAGSGAEARGGKIMIQAAIWQIIMSLHHPDRRPLGFNQEISRTGRNIPIRTIREERWSVRGRR